MLRFGIIGCGRIAQRHALLISQYGKLVAVCDIDEARAKSLAESYQASCYTSCMDMLANSRSMDVVVVCTPNWLHVQHTVQALNAGFHVLCEKPMAISSAGCRQMLDAATANNKLLFIVKQNRFNPPVVAVKNAIDEGALGKLYSFHLSCFWNRDERYYENSWHGKKMEDGGTLFTQFSHFVDVLYWLMGDVESAKAITANLAHVPGVEFEDTGAVLMEMKNGAVGTMHYSVNSYRKNMEGSLTLLAEKGAVKIGGQYLNLLEYQHLQDHLLQVTPSQAGSNNYGFYTGSMSNHDKVYENLVAVLQNGARAYMDACDAMKTVEIIERIYKAAQESRTRKQIK
ncbi:Gfo/Idh/MocA family protein [Foetidibacter luteolus]|uniref:Gfo/Idh/MocA family protein n=1 Tax=Foetidibacter luteolus TaxID=2608880 RepID=UPI00129B8603|nr:Gfo/Idh/MocA family oxidoreductase [Foetidibacter luteolus]